VRLANAKMIDRKPHIGMTIDDLGAVIEIVPDHQIDRHIVTRGGAHHTIQTLAIRCDVRRLLHHDADADGRRDFLPLRDDITDRRIIRIDRLDQGEAARMGLLHFHRVARVIAIHGEGRDEDRAMNADLVHRRDHFVARHMCGPVRHAMPRPLRVVGVIGVDLRINNHHCSNAFVS